MLLGTQMWRPGKRVNKINFDFYINVTGNLQCMFREDFGGQGHGKFTRMFRNKRNTQQKNIVT
jgi:hypothetical protein